jgi:type II secretory pathway predicted ATPase ExeA
MRNNIWYKKNGFNKNPLSVKPGLSKLIGYEKEIDELEKDLGKKQSIWEIQGEYGTGKTTILKGILKKYDKNHRIVYFSHNRVDGSVNIRRLLISKNTFFKKLIGIVPSDIILLIDESANLNTKEVSELIYYYKLNHIKNIILVNINFKNHRSYQMLKELIGKNVINLTKITKEASVEMVHERLDEKDLISSEAIMQIYDLAKGNPRKILEYSENAIKIAYSIGDGRATDRHVILLRESLEK